MSGLPARIIEPPHRSGTTWRGFALAWQDADENPLDLSGAAARLVGVDAGGTVVLDWELGNPAKPGLDLPDPESGVLYLRGPGVLVAAPGRITWDLKIAMANEIFIDLAGELPIIDGPNQ